MVFLHFFFFGGGQNRNIPTEYEQLAGLAALGLV